MRCLFCEPWLNNFPMRQNLVLRFFFCPKERFRAKDKPLSHRCRTAGASFSLPLQHRCSIAFAWLRAPLAHRISYVVAPLQLRFDIKILNSQSIRVGSRVRPRVWGVKGGPLTPQKQPNHTPLRPHSIFSYLDCPLLFPKSLIHPSIQSF